MFGPNKTVIITGSSSGIGFDIARSYLVQGANVVLNGRDPVKLEKTSEILGSPERLSSVGGNIGDKATGESLVRVALDWFKKRN